MTPIEALLELTSLVAVCHPAGRVGEASPPYCILYPEPGLPFDRPLAGRTGRRVHIFRLLAVSNNPKGAVMLSERLVEIIDGAQHNGSSFWVEAVSSPLPDDDDPVRTLWSCTLEIRYHS